MQVTSFAVATLVGLSATPASSAAQPFEVSIRNTGTAVLACDASLAHWFSDTLGEIEPGETLRFILYAEVASGTVFIRNSTGQDMPVQRLWCGSKGRSWATRFEIPLNRRAGMVPAAISLECAGVGEKTTCNDSA